MIKKWGCPDRLLNTCVRVLTHTVVFTDKNDTDKQELTASEKEKNVYYPDQHLSLRCITLKLEDECFTQAFYHSCFSLVTNSCRYHFCFISLLYQQFVQNHALNQLIHTTRTNIYAESSHELQTYNLRDM